MGDDSGSIHGTLDILILLVSLHLGFAFITTKTLLGNLPFQKVFVNNYLSPYPRAVPRTLWQSGSYGQLPQRPASKTTSKLVRIMQSSPAQVANLLIRNVFSYFNRDHALPSILLYRLRMPVLRSRSRGVTVQIRILPRHSLPRRISYIFYVFTLRNRAHPFSSLVPLLSPAKSYKQFSSSSKHPHLSLSLS